MDATRRLAAKEYTTEQFLKEIRDVCKAERIKFELQREEGMKLAANSLKEGLKQISQVKINEKAIFKNLLPCEKDRLIDVMSNAGKKYDRVLTQIACNLAEEQNCTTPMEFCAVLEFVASYVAKTTKSAKLSANQSRAKYRSELQAKLTDSKTDQFMEMNSKFHNLKARIQTINETSLFQFKCNKAATYHFYKHDGFKGRTVSEQGYFDILNELFGKEVNKAYVKLTQEGDKVRIIYTDPTDGLFGVLIQPRHLQGGAGLYVATMFYDPGLVRRA